MVDAAKVMRSPLVRCVLGSQADRRGGIEKHIDATVRVLKNVRSKVMDAGLKVAIENHAGDMQARELKGLIEMAGREYVGACIDSGNAVWTIEDPHLTLETLAPYVETSHVRDSYVFNSTAGTAVQWSRMGDGNVGIDDYIRTYVAAMSRQGRLARGHRQRRTPDVQLPRSAGVGSLQDDAGLGVCAVPGALRQGHATAAAAARSRSRSRGWGGRPRRRTESRGAETKP